MGKPRGTNSKHRYMYLEKNAFQEETKIQTLPVQLCRNIATTLKEVSFPAAGGTVFVHLMNRNTTYVLKSCEALGFSVRFFQSGQTSFFKENHSLPFHCIF